MQLKKLRFGSSLHGKFFSIQRLINRLRKFFVNKQKISKWLASN